MRESRLLKLSINGDLEARKELHRLRCRKLPLNPSIFQSRYTVWLGSTDTYFRFQAEVSNAYNWRTPRGTGSGYGSSALIGNLQGNGRGIPYHLGNSFGGALHAANGDASVPYFGSNLISR